MCVFEIELSVVCAGAFSFFMLFMGKLALYNGGFLGFLRVMYFSMYYFIKSQAFIRVLDCIFFFVCFCFLSLYCVCVLFIIIAR